VKRKSYQSLTFLVLVSAGSNLFGQHSMAPVLNINHDYFQLSDPGEEFEIRDRPNISFGSVYRYQLKNHVTVNSGITFKHFDDVIGFRNFNSWSSGTGDQVLEVPLAIGYNKRLFREGIFTVSPLVGAGLNTVLNAASVSTGTIKVVGPMDSIVSVSHSHHLKSFYITATVGFQFEIKLGAGLTLVTSFQYYRGFSTVTEYFYTYRRNLNPPVNAVKKGNGSYLTVLGVKLYYTFPGLKEKNPKSMDVEPIRENE
jgi:hypothetical protein